MSVAFVLTPHAVLPDDGTLIDAYYRVAPNGHEVRSGERSGDAVTTLVVERAGRAYVTATPAPVPGGEAERSAIFGVSTLGRAWTPVHAAHFVVSVEAARLSRLEQLLLLTKVAAAVADSTGAIGVYWAGGQATHPTEWFVDGARRLELPMRLWCGVSVAADPHRVQLLSLGMAQLGLPDLLLNAARIDGGPALDTFFDLLASLTHRGAPLEPGHNVGRAASVPIPVRYQPSPIDPSVQVWCVDLPRRSR